MEKKKKNNKLFIIPLLAIFGVGLVLAGVYVVNNFVIQSDVYEPFTVQYAIIGDAGNYVSGDCADVSVWTDYSTLDQPIDMQGLYAGESRKFCVKIDNAGEAGVPYVIQSEVVTGLGNYNDCIVAFPEVTKTGTVPGSSSIYDGEVISVPANAPIVNDCQLQISVARGTLDE